jgi:hypothetical protein
MDKPEFESLSGEFDRLLTLAGRLWGHPASNAMGTGARSGVGGTGGGGRGRDVLLTTQLHQVPRLRMSGAVLPLRLYFFVGWTKTTLPFFLPFILRT